MRARRIQRFGQALLAVAVPGSPTLAAEWHGASYGGRNSDQSAVFVDATSVTRAGTTVRFWTKTFFETPTSTGTDEVDEYAEANCSDRSSRSLAFAFHTGDKVGEYEPDSSKIKYNPPGSIFSAVIGQVCDGSYLTGALENPRSYAQGLFTKSD